MALCCNPETPIEEEARLSSARLRSTPVPIWWHRRRIHGPPASLLEGNDGRPSSSPQDVSPFPRSWSINYTGSSVAKLACATEESSVFSTASQEHRLRRDARGNCIRHPHVQLARKRRAPSTRQLKSRISKMKMFSKQSSTASAVDGQKEEWVILHERCPECEKEQIAKSKARYHHKPKVADDTDNMLQNAGVTHEPFPATLKLISSHPSLAEGTLAIRIRTDPIPAKQTRHLSFAAKEGDDGDIFWKWKTPDGALDSVVPTDANGEIRSEIPLYKKDEPQKKHSDDAYQYHIMERIIPLSSIDHVSRGGDAWDILRRSTGEGDLGCNCDVKIHGFSDRLLRFDVVKFDAMQSYGGNANPRLRHSFGPLDFSHFSASGSESKDARDDNNGGGGPDSDHYTTENVISMLNSVVAWDRETRKSSWASRMQSVSRWLEEWLSLGVPRVDGQGSERKSSAEGAPRFDIDSKYIM
ncbi:hypothetical protein ACHAXT_002999 [Thalassiosira profunda]